MSLVGWVGYIIRHRHHFTTLILMIRAHIMYLAEFSFNMVALLLASMKISVISLMSVLIILVRPQILAFIDPGVRSCKKIIEISHVFLQTKQSLPALHI